jgi:DNA primase catalytic core
MQIRDIKAHLSLQKVLDHYKLKPNHHNMLHCPFPSGHTDNKPSMKVYAETNTFNCFGCGKNGDVIEFIQEMEQCTKRTAILKAKELVGEKVSSSKPACSADRNQDTRKESLDSCVSVLDTKIIEKIFSYFHSSIKKGSAKKAMEYLELRGLDYTKLVVGYNAAQFHHRGRISPEDMKLCEQAGLLIPSKNGSVANFSYTPWAKDCIIFPLKDKTGNIVSLYGRSIVSKDAMHGVSTSKPTDTMGKHFYLKSRRGLYPCYPVRPGSDSGAPRLILTEAIIDAATLLQLPEVGKQYQVLSLYGTNGFTHEHKEAIQHWCSGGIGNKEVIIFFDGDKPGREAILRTANEVYNIDTKLRITAVETPDEEDINSLYLNYDEEAILQLLQERQSVTVSPERVKTQCIASQSPPEPAILNTQNPQYIIFQPSRQAGTSPELEIILLGGINMNQLDRLRVTIKLSNLGTAAMPCGSVSISTGVSSGMALRHTLDLYHSDYLEKLINKASEQLEIGTSTLRNAMAELIDKVEQYRLQKVESLKEQRPQERKLTEERVKKAIEYLSHESLMERTNADIGRTGMIGEENNRLLMYLVFTSRLREQPLHIISLGASGTGKTYLQEKVSELIPEHHKLEITILSENAFYYFGQKELKNKLVLIEDMDGAENVLYPLRELQSKKRISKTIPIKDSKGNLKTITLKVEGPICLAGTTTKEKLYEDNANRSLLIYLDNSNEHKEHIMDYQRKLSAGKVATKQELQLIEFFKDMQTVLKPVKVRNPFAEYLVIPEHVFKPLRTNSHYLAFIETITFYHQYQRELKTDKATGENYIETTLEDIEWANKLLKDVLLAKADELPKAIRQFFESLKSWMQTANKNSFYTKEVRDVFRMHPSKVKRYVVELLRYGFIKVVGGNRYKNGLEYEITNTDEYQKLESGIVTALDKVLDDLRETLSGSVGQTWSKTTNRPLNSNDTNNLKAVGQ